MKSFFVTLAVMMGYFVLANTAYALPPKPNLPGGPAGPNQPTLPTQPQLPPMPSCSGNSCATPAPTATPVGSVATPTPSSNSGSTSSNSSSSSSDSNNSGIGGEVLSLSATGTNGFVSIVTVLGILCLGLGVRLATTSQLKRE